MLIVNKNAKNVIIALLFCALCLCLSMCSEDIASVISGEDGKCDYCDKKAGIGQGTKEYCGPCFQKYDGNFWN